ncbi:MAG: TM0106 family RecB-like putative nuclease, partial [Dehalococcoidia bacterium]|nr:TM0106 family RecB-like putative nuclease [Dehalococcoidia bacterium]
MQIIDGQLIYSATDLVGFIECTHLANLNRAVAERKLEPPHEKDPVLDRIAQRGYEHEQRFLAGLQHESGGLTVVEVSEDPDRERPILERLRRGREATLDAMRSGADVIYQAVLFDGRRQGYADFLRRVDTPANTPSDLGAWSYEVWDTKLARHPKASAVLQLSLYSDMVGAMQGFVPAEMHLALGGVEAETASFRVSDFAAYYRLVARRFEEHLGGESPADVAAIPTAPEPTDHCAVCRWSLRCSRELREADDLSRVAGLTSRQRRGLIEFEIPTRTALAETALPLASKVPGASPAALERIHEQARVQVEGERRGAPYFERIPLPRDREDALTPNYGLGMLPPPSEGDLFFDIEGDPFYSSPQGDGVDYLFGVIEPAERDASGDPDTARFHAFWSIEDGEVTAGAERRAFEAFIDLTMDRLRRDPGMHVYHYAPYEPTAVKRLAGRYGTREAEVDELLRGNVFVDLYRAVRQGIRAAVESYSIKKLEPLYGFGRDIDLKDAGTSIVEFETWLELSDTNEEGIDRGKLLTDIEAYNRDDCVSTWRLRDWLEAQRALLEAETGEAIPRPADVQPEDREASERQQRIAELVERLTHDVPEDEQTPEQHGRWLLAQMLNWHAREQKSFWWRYYFLMQELTDEERREEPDSLAGLEFVSSRPDTTPRARSTIYRFTFPPQDHKITVGSRPHDPATGTGFGAVYSLDEAGVIELRRGNGEPPPYPTSLVPHDPIPTKPKPEA